MKNIKYLCLVVLLLPLVSIAQTPPAVLTAGDVDKFIKTFRPMTQELEAIGYEMDDNMTEQMKTNAKVLTVLKKYGWDMYMWGKWASVSVCYSKLKMDEQLASMPVDEREQMKKMMSMAGSGFDKLVNPEDLKLVKAKMAQLDAVMDVE